MLAKRSQVQFREGGLFEKRRQENGVRRVNPRTDQFEVHRGFVFRPLREFRWINATLVVFPCPVVDGEETVVTLRAVEQDVERTLSFVQRIDGFKQVIGIDLPSGQALLFADFFDEVNEINIVFPIPGETEVVVHGRNCTGLF